MAEAGSKWTLQGILVVGLCFLLNMVDGMDILVVSYIAPALQKEWDVGPAEFAIVFSAGLGGMAIGGLGVAPLADRFGRRRLIISVLPPMALAMMASSYANSVSQLAMARVLVGIGTGTVLACISALAAEHAPLARRNFAVGFVQGGYPVGAMLTGFATAWALPHIGWRGVLFATGIVTLLVIPLVAIAMPESRHLAEIKGKIAFGDAVAGVRLKSSMSLWCATVCSFMALYFIASWITKLAIEAGLPQTQAIIASAIYNLGAFVGVTAMSIAATHIDIRKLAARFLIAAALAFLWFGGVHMSVNGVLLAAFVLGLALQGGFNALYPLAVRLYPAEVRATGVGWAMGIGRIGGFIGPLLGGWALSIKLPLVAVFGIFCVPLLIAALAVSLVQFDQDRG